MVQLAGLLVEHEIEVAPNRSQRRTQLVGDEGQELVLQPVELQKSLVLLDQGAPAASASVRASWAVASDCSRVAACRISRRLRSSTAAVTRRRIGTSVAQSTISARSRKPPTGRTVSLAWSATRARSPGRARRHRAGAAGRLNREIRLQRLDLVPSMIDVVDVARALPVQNRLVACSSSGRLLPIRAGLVE